MKTYPQKDLYLNVHCTFICYDWKVDTFNYSSQVNKQFSFIPFTWNGKKKKKRQKQFIITKSVSVVFWQGKVARAWNPNYLEIGGLSKEGKTLSEK
jgi:hypothetical protein